MTLLYSLSRGSFPPTLEERRSCIAAPDLMSLMSSFSSGAERPSSSSARPGALRFPPVLQFLTEAERGYWEQRGYSTTANPWEEERYG